MNDKKVNIELTKEEAIVFFEFLGRFNDNDDLNRFEDQSEQRVLWDMECALEKELSEPFRADYLEILKKARETVRDEKE
jgi:hypothetical protein